METGRVTEHDSTSCTTTVNLQGLPDGLIFIARDDLLKERMDLWVILRCVQCGFCFALYFILSFFFFKHHSVIFFFLLPEDMSEHLRLTDVKSTHGPWVKWKGISVMSETWSVIRLQNRGIMRKMDNCCHKKEERNAKKRLSDLAIPSLARQSKLCNWSLLINTFFRAVDYYKQAFGAYIVHKLLLNV